MTRGCRKLLQASHVHHAQLGLLPIVRRSCAGQTWQLPQIVASAALPRGAAVGGRAQRQRFEAGPCASSAPLCACADRV